MSDPLVTLANHPLGAKLLDGLGLPTPARLVRAAGGYEATPLAGKTVLLLAAPGGYATDPLRAALASAGARVLGVAPDAAAAIDVLVFDGTGIRAAVHHRALYDAFHPLVRRITHAGRVLVAAAAPEQASDAAAAAAARGVEGFVRSLAKEIGRRGAQANLVYVETGAADRVEGPVRYLCTARSTYVDGQALRLSAVARAPARVAHTAALAGKTALVTGAARGIGAATAQRLAEEGARVVHVDVPAARAALDAAAGAGGGLALTLDVASADAPARLAAYLREHGGVDVVVHNAGITRDKTLGKMSPEQWDAVSSVNLQAIVALDGVLLDAGILRDEGRVVCLSSQSGIAGNFGQTNYATSKAALIGYVAARAPGLAPRGICINAVAPGFIETPMTEAMPFVRRELGRRMSSLGQGGQPRDVAELIAFLASPGACGVTGNCIRVCGQGWFGA